MKAHRCTTAGCAYLGQPSATSCLCHQTDLQVLRESHAELLEALEGCLHFDDGFVGSGIIRDALDKWREAARAAIAKAKAAGAGA